VDRAVAEDVEIRDAGSVRRMLTVLDGDPADGEVQLGGRVTDERH
jgi:hypothetical protein